MSTKNNDKLPEVTEGVERVFTSADGKHVVWYTGQEDVGCPWCWMADDSCQGDNRNSFAEFVPKSWLPLMPIFAPEDSDMERITDIKQVRVGDTEVLTSGERFEVVEVDCAPDQVSRLRVNPSVFVNRRNCWVYDSAFAYALRPKPKVPTEPGLYFDSEKDMWELDSENNRILLRRNGRYGKYGYGRKGLDAKYAPYSRIDLEADHE